jgi:hypothetical protein
MLGKDYKEAVLELNASDDRYVSSPILIIFIIFIHSFIYTLL